MLQNHQRDQIQNECRPTYIIENSRHDDTGFNIDIVYVINQMKFNNIVRTFHSWQNNRCYLTSNNSLMLLCANLLIAQVALGFQVHRMTVCYLKS